ncbi:MAG: hypothetical protein LBU81_02705 [Methanosarcinales archaeon]|jgi:hypothetical protein|nr:hypothetical protein [Methanosarcinales archaeon]
MNNKTAKLSLLIFLIFVGFIVPAFATEDMRESDTGLEYEEVVKILEQSTPTTPDSLYELLKQDNVLAVYGKIPLKEGIDSYEWWLKLEEVAESLANDKEFDKYDYTAGIGSHTDGYIYIQILEKNKESIKSQELDTIKKYVEKHAEMHGIKDVPLVIKVVKPMITFATNPNSYVANPLAESESVQ